MQAEYGIFIRAKDGELIGRVTDYTSLHILDTLNDVGSWNIQSRTQSPCPFEPGTGIIVVRNSEFLYGGILEKIQDTLDAKTGLYTWYVSGIGDLGYLNRRICHVSPMTGSTTVYSHYVDNGKIAKVIENLIQRNLGIEALPERVESIVTRNSDTNFGEEVTVSLRFQNLLRAIVRLCRSNGYNIRPRWNQYLSKVYYELFVGNNLTQDFVFSEQLNNIVAAEFLAKAPEANYILAGGTGEMTARQFAVAENTDSVEQWGRIEKFQDGRSQNEIETYAVDTLNKKSENLVGYSCTASSVDNAPQYGIDYKLGDIISMKIGKTFVAAEVQQVEISVEGGTESVTPRFGTVAVGKFRELFSQISSVRDDLDELLGEEVE